MTTVFKQSRKRKRALKGQAEMMRQVKIQLLWPPAAVMLEILMNALDLRNVQATWTKVCSYQGQQKIHNLSRKAVMRIRR